MKVMKLTVCDAFSAVFPDGTMDVGAGVKISIGAIGSLIARMKNILLIQRSDFIYNTYH